MTAFMRCIHCNVTFLQPEHFVTHPCNVKRSPVDVLRRLQETINNHPSNRRGDAS